MLGFKCGKCGELAQASEEDAGKTVSCPACGQTSLVPMIDADIDQPLDKGARSESAGVGENSPPGRGITDQPPTIGPKVTSGRAIGSLVLGIMSFLFNIFTGLPAILLGILALVNISGSRDRVKGQGLAIAGIVVACIGMLSNTLSALLILNEVHYKAARLLSQNNLKQMGLAIHLYNDIYDHLPPAAIGRLDQPPAAGEKPLLSWRVHILPGLNESYLYSQFKLDEPWDSPDNIKLLPQMPKIYRLPGNNKTPPDHTHYQVFVGNGAAFEKDRVLHFSSDFPDGLAQTIMIVEAAQSVPWTKPDDIPFNPNEPVSPLLSKFFRGTNVALMDGSARFLPLDTPESVLKAAITRNGNEKMPSDW
jgi:hypothetical protein